MGRTVFVNVTLDFFFPSLMRLAHLALPLPEEVGHSIASYRRTMMYLGRLSLLNA